MLSEKIKRILNDKHLSPSRFADEIGVPRSSVSHILSGRNKPSLDMVQKILRRFPELGTDWVLTADTESTPAVPPAEPFLSSPAPTEKVPKSTGRHSADRPATHQETPPSTQAARSVASPPPVPVMREKEIEKILIFYADKTFTEYRPS